MVTHIQFHRSCVAGATPDVSTMYEGEPAVNLTDGILWVKGCTSELVLFPTGVSSVNGSTGDVTITDLVGVETFNGATGDVQGVGSFNGLTGTVDTSTLLIHADGISADGATFGDNINLGGNLVHSGDTDTLLQFDTNQVTLKAGNAKLLEGNVNGVLHVPTGVSGGGATFSENVLIENAGDVSLTIKGDTDNSGENDNPLIRLEQDGGAVSCNIGINGDSNNQFVGAQPNAFYIEAESSSGAANQLIQFATNNADVMTLNGDGNVGINTSVPREKLEVVGTIQTAGISADGATLASLNVNSAYSLPTADGSAGQVLMTDGSDAVSFQTIKFTTSFVLDSDIPLATGSRDKAFYIIPYANAVITEVILRSEDVAASSDTTSLVVALEAIQRLNVLNDADPATSSTIMSITLNDTSDNHYHYDSGLSHAIGEDNNIRAIRINVTDNSGNHTHCQVMIKMEARTT